MKCDEDSRDLEDIGYSESGHLFRRGERQSYVLSSEDVLFFDTCKMSCSSEYVPNRTVRKGFIKTTTVTIFSGLKEVARLLIIISSEEFPVGAKAGEKRWC